MGRPAHKEARQEKYRLTIADCPGLLPDASSNVGLGHDFLRHIERSRVLVYVVDLSSKDPERDLAVLRQELDIYKPGLSKRARIIVANKADAVDSGSTSGEEEVGGGGGGHDESQDGVERMRRKLAGLRGLSEQWQAEDGLVRKVIPMSAMNRHNVSHLVDALVEAVWMPDGQPPVAGERR